ncbi:MAG: hypothetical protein HFI38_03055 [Lachnospiraceae bacterium]|jgi:hypothetical protein|nr:hypothetical protein [Lachnospiraceae bacterium]
MSGMFVPEGRSCYKELTRDPLYAKIPSNMRLAVCDRAWETGVQAARTACEQMREEGMEKIQLLIEKKQLKVERVDEDQVVGNLRFFGEYVEKQKKIFLYSLSVCRLAEKRRISCSQAEELILAHEYFHFLECTSLGPTSGQYMVWRWKAGRFHLGKSGIRALSEIGAHGFSYTYWELCHGTPEQGV